MSLVRLVRVNIEDKASESDAATTECRLVATHRQNEGVDAVADFE